ncbi:hypothetical protein GCM10011584_20180 [Nocardioides phosphati]|uniref:Lipoprotein n=2 Tax=Nocardioides phosphati TaxID=1867775 RepID=A0ABQ2NFE4_9ACTN|nr:hypothetical protein GCM10011584_20180 [Nocardioides phosphati]
MPGSLRAHTDSDAGHHYGCAMHRIALGLAFLLALPLTACSDDGDATGTAPPKPGVTCMQHQKVVGHLEPTHAGLPQVDADIGRSWEPLSDAPDAGGIACANLSMERPPAGWKLVRYQLRMKDWLHTTTLSGRTLESLDTVLRLEAYECVRIDATLVLARAGHRDRWTGHTTISPRCKD